MPFRQTFRVDYNYSNKNFACLTSLASNRCMQPRYWILARSFGKENRREFDFEKVFIKIENR